MAVRQAAWLGAAGLVWLAAALPAAAGPKTLTGEEIRSQIVGNTVSGQMGAAFTEFYNPDGSIHGSSGDGAYQGKWHIDGDALCLEYDEPLGCRKIALDGETVTYITEEGEVDGSGTLLKGNPNHY
jgi:hypothetical protein